MHAFIHFFCHLTLLLNGPLTLYRLLALFSQFALHQIRPSHFHCGHSFELLRCRFGFLLLQGIDFNCLRLRLSLSFELLLCQCLLGYSEGHLDRRLFRHTVYCLANRIRLYVWGGRAPVLGAQGCLAGDQDIEAYRLVSKAIDLKIKGRYSRIVSSMFS